MPTMIEDSGTQPDPIETFELAARRSERLAIRTRCGRYVVVRDIVGRWHAFSAGLVSASFEDESGECSLMISGGRLIRLDELMVVLFHWPTGPGR